MPRTLTGSFPACFDPNMTETARADAVDFVQNGEGVPTTAPVGGKGIYFDTLTDSMYYYDGSTWVQLIGE